MFRFNIHCINGLPDTIELHDNTGEQHTLTLHWSRGPGFVTLSLATIFFGACALLHAVIPTPPSRWQVRSRSLHEEDDEEEKDDNGKLASVHTRQSEREAEVNSLQNFT